MQHVCSGHVDLAVEENPERTIAVTLADQRLASFNPDFVEMSGEIDKLRTRNRREEGQLSQLASPRTLPPISRCRAPIIFCLLDRFWRACGPSARANSA